MFKGKLDFLIDTSVNFKYNKGRGLIMSEEQKKKQPTIKTLKDKGTKVDLVELGDGSRTLFYQIEKTRELKITLGIWAFRIGWSDKYAVIPSPETLTRDTLEVMAKSGSTITGSIIKPEDFIPLTVSGTVGIGFHGTAEVKEIGK